MICNKKINGIHFKNREYFFSLFLQNKNVLFRLFILFLLCHLFISIICHQIFINKKIKFLQQKKKHFEKYYFYVFVDLSYHFLRITFLFLKSSTFFFLCLFEFTIIVSFFIHPRFFLFCVFC